MTVAWLLFAAALALVPLGSPGGMRLARIAGTAEEVPRPAAVALPTTAPMPAAMLVGSVVAAWLGPALGTASGVVVLTSLVALRRYADRKRARRSTAAALLVVRAVLAEVEAGASPADAVDAAASAGSGVHASDAAMLARRLRTHRDPGAVNADLFPLAHALRVSVSSGAAAAPVLDRVADQLQAVADQRDAVAAILAGVRSSALLLALLPLVGLVLGTGLGASPLTVLAGSSAGHGLVFMGVVLECAGLAWTWRLTTRAEDVAA